MHTVCSPMYMILLPPATKFGQGYIFTGMCDSVHRGGVGIPACTEADPPPPGADPPWEQTPPRSRHPPGADTPPGQDPPGADTPPPGAEHSTRYGQCAGGTHPTGRQSCFN